MSRNPFGSDVFDAPEKSHKYHSGTESSLEEETARRLVHEYMTIDSSHRVMPAIKHMEAERSVPYADLDIQGVVDHLIGELVLGDEESQRLSGGLFDHFLNYAQDSSADPIVLDFSDFSRPPRDIARYCQGSAEDKLTLEIILSEGPQHTTIGLGAEFCDIVVRGHAGTVGQFSRNCVFALDEGPDMVGGRTYSAETSDCSYYFPDARQVVLRSRQEEYELWTYPLDTPSIKDPMVFGLEGQRRTNVSYSFFSVGNHLMVPDGSGGWREVRPK